MQKTKLGISVGVFGALLYFSGLFSGYLLTTLLAGYVLFNEENLWLKKTAIKAVVLMVCFSILNAVVGVLPEAVNIVDYTFSILGLKFSLHVIDKISTILLMAISIVEKIVFIILGLRAFSQGTVNIPMIDGFVNKTID